MDFLLNLNQYFSNIYIFTNIPRKCCLKYFQRVSHLTLFMVLPSQYTILDVLVCTYCMCKFCHNIWRPVPWLPPWHLFTPHYFQQYEIWMIDMFQLEDTHYTAGVQINHDAAIWIRSISGSKNKIHIYSYPYPYPYISGSKNKIHIRF